MSATTADKMVYRVRHMIGAVSQSAGDPSLPAILDALDRAMVRLHAELPGLAGLNSSFITVVASDYDYTLSESEPISLQEFRLQSSGNPVFPVSLARWLEYRTGNPTSTGDPLIIAFSEAASGTVTAYLWPTPAKSDVIEAVRATNVSSVFQGMAGSDLSGITLNFGNYGTLAICHMAAANLLPDGAERARNEREAAALIHREACRQAAYYAGDGSLPYAI